MTPTSESIVSSSGGRPPVWRSGESAAADCTAMLRFVTAVPGSPAMAIARDSMTIFRIAAFGALSPYVGVSGSAVVQELRSARLPDAVATIAASLDGGLRYTLAADADTAGVLRLGLVRDDLVNADGKARVRVISVVRGTNAFRVAVVGQNKPFLADYDFRGDASTTDLDPMTAAFKVRRKVESAGVIVRQSMDLVVGTACTFVLAPLPRGELVAIAFRIWP